MKSPVVAIFGAKGEMGRHLLVPLLQKKADVIAIDVDSSGEDVSKAWKADLIVLAIPQSSLQELCEGVSLNDSQLVLDICSCKKGIHEVVSATGAQHFSVHPMNGPLVPWTRQKWVLVGQPPDHPLAEWFLELLREKHVMFHSVENTEEHDLLMSVVLGVPELMTIVLSEFFKKYSSKAPNALQIENLMKITSPAFSSLLKTYVHTACSSPLWLREDLLREMHPDFIDACREVFQSLTPADFYDHVQSLMQQQVKDIGDLEAPENFLSIVREHVTDDFNLMNQIFLGEGLPKNTDLYIQKSDPAEKILPKSKKVTVGIHGIKGAFTDEAWHRFATEHLNVSEDYYEIVELVHSANVQRAVEEGEVDRGIFAFANSGSGGYLESIEAMGAHRYDLMGLFTMPIHMCILSHPSIQNIHDLDSFFGHPVALSQCRKTLAQRWPDIPIEPATDEMDTALSAKLLSEGDIDASKGVFAAKRAADIYGLNVLAEGVHHDPSNATAFAVIQKRND